MPALLDWASLGDVLRRAQMARLSPSVRMAHRLLAFTAARIGNVVTAEWRVRTNACLRMPNPYQPSPRPHQNPGGRRNLVKPPRRRPTP